MKKTRTYYLMMIARNKNGEIRKKAKRHKVMFSRREFPLGMTAEEVVAEYAREYPVAANSTDYYYIVVTGNWKHVMRLN